MQPRASILWCDNVRGTYLITYHVFHARTRHIEVDLHLMRENVALGALDVHFLSSGDQVANGFTKPVTQQVRGTIPTSQAAKIQG